MKNLLIVITLLFSLFGCKNQQETSSEANTGSELNAVTLNEEQLKLAGVQLGNLEKKEISTLIKVSGKIDVPPQNLVSVSIPLGGYLKSTKLLPGMHLNRGEVIAVLEDQQYIQLQQDFLTTQARLALSEAEFKRQKELNEKKATSDKLFQQAKTEYEAQQITLKALAEKLKLINVDASKLTVDNISKEINLYAPFDGYVSKVNANIGKYITPSDVLFELVNPKDIHLNLQVFEKDLVQLSVGQKLVAYTNSNPEVKHKCEIILISKDINAERTAEVHCHFEDYDKNLLPGMYMNAEIEINNAVVAAVPENALLLFEGENYLFTVVSKGVFSMQEVQVGSSENGWVEIKNAAVFQQKQIVVNGAYALLMSMKNKQEE